MVKSSSENEEINDSPPEYSTVNGQAQEESAILIEIELLKAQNEIAMAALTAHILQQEESRGRSSRELIKLTFTISIMCLLVLSPVLIVAIPFIILFT